MRSYNLKLWSVAAILTGLLLIAPSILCPNSLNAAETIQTLPTGQRIHPAGQTLAFNERPVDIALSPDKQIVFVKGTHHLLVLDAAKLQEIQRLRYPEGEDGSMHGIAVSDDTVYVTGSHKFLLEAHRNNQSRWEWRRQILLSSNNSNPCGIAMSSSKHIAYVCLSMSNSLAIVDLDKAKVTKEIPTGVCPMAIALDKDGLNAYVSNYGGRLSHSGEHVENSAGTSVVVDDRSISSSGTISRINLSSEQNTGELAVGLHPADLKVSANGSLFVANANSDSISRVNLSSFVLSETIPVRLDPQLPFGSIPNALCLSDDEKCLFTANAGNNAIAMIKLSSVSHRGSTLNGFVPAGWFPGAICSDGKNLFIANTKGESSILNTPGAKKFNCKTNRGSVSKISIPGGDELHAYSKQVGDDSGVNQILDSLKEKARDLAPVPIPERVGEPSSIEHVVYVIKENRTYDQVFGDLPRGNNDASLCTYGREVTPNHHALAEQFVLLDNYYCNGVVSADGHQWATQGVVSDYQEKMFGGHPRAYDFGTDALAYAGCNFLWDSALQRGLTNLNPYLALPNQIALDERTANTSSLKEERKLTQASNQLDLSHPDRVDDDDFNRILWHASMGKARYPAAQAGAHGNGLKDLKLKLISGKGISDD